MRTNEVDRGDIRTIYGFHKMVGRGPEQGSQPKPFDCLSECVGDEGNDPEAASTQIEGIYPKA